MSELVEIGGEFVEVEFAKQVKEEIISSSVLKFKDEKLKETILTTSDDQLLIISYTINSPKTIQSVRYFNEQYLNEIL